MKKYICCIHDKKADVYEGFMMFDNLSQAVRSFQQGCEQVDTFKKWPEDYEMILVCVIKYENGEIDDKGNVTKKGQFLPAEELYTVIAQAKEFVAIANAKRAQKD